MNEPSAAYLDPRVVEAQKRGAERMTDDQLLREIRLVSGFSEQPPIRVVYIRALTKERVRRGL